MNGRGVAATVAGGLGLVAVVVTAAIVAAVTLVALGLPAASPADDSPPVAGDAPAATAPPRRPRELVVALAPGDPVLQAGVVRGSAVLLARGYEVAVVRAVAERLGIERVRFVRAASSERLLLGDGPSWDVAVAAIRPSRLASGRGAVTLPYLTTDKVVLLRRGTARPRSEQELRTRIVCAIRSTDAARAAVRLGAKERPILAPGPARLVQLVQRGACDAALLEPTTAARVVDGNRAVLGGIAARLRWDAGIVAVVARRGAVPVARVDRALRQLRADGTLRRLARFWLGLDPSALPVLR